VHQNTPFLCKKNSKIFWGGAPDPDPGGASNSLAPALLINDLNILEVGLLID